MSTPDAPAEPPAAVSLNGPAGRRQHRRWLVLARAACLAVSLLTVTLWAISILPHYHQHVTLSTPSVVDADLARARLAALGLTVGVYAGYTLALEVVLALAFFAVAAVLLWRRSDEGVALLVALFLVTVGATYPGTVQGLAAIHPVLYAVAGSLRALGTILLLLVLYLFPDGRFVPGWTRWPAAGWAAAWALAPLIPGSPVTVERWPPPLPFFLLFLGFVGTGVAAQAHRYRRVSTAAQRQQIKWVALGLTVALAAYVGFSVPLLLAPGLLRSGQAPLYDLIRVTALVLCALLVPLTIGLAILRYRLWDIDILIRRTLVYGALTTALVLVYVGSVVLFQELLRPLTGQGTNDLAIIASTLAIAALFHPLRQRIQGFIDRRFYRRTYDAAQVLAAFSARLRDETDVDMLADEVLAVVQETMQPSHVSLWLRPPPRPTPSLPEQPGQGPAA